MVITVNQRLPNRLTFATSLPCTFHQAKPNETIIAVGQIVDPHLPSMGRKLLPSDYYPILIIYIKPLSLVNSWTGMSY